MPRMMRSILIDGPNTILRVSKLICVLIMYGLDSNCQTRPKKSVKLFQVENSIMLLSTWLQQIALVMNHHMERVEKIGLVHKTLSQPQLVSWPMAHQISNDGVTVHERNYCRTFGTSNYKGGIPDGFFYQAPWFFIWYICFTGLIVKYSGAEAAHDNIFTKQIKFKPRHLLNFRMERQPAEKVWQGKWCREQQVLEGQR